MRSLSKFALSLSFLLLCAPAFAQAGSSADTVQYVDDPQVLYSSDTTLVHSGNAEYADEPDEQYLQPRNKAVPSQVQWDSLTADNALGYKNEREFTPVKQEEYKPPKPPAWWRAVLAFLGFFTTTAGQIILWSALVLLIGFIIYRLASGERGLFARRGLTIKTEKSADELSPEDLLEGSWEDKLHRAMQAGDYRLAVRYGYLLMLQLLQRRELIVYRPDKTNTDYYRELAGTRESLRPGFRSMTRAYEWAWYGGSPTTQQEAEAYFDTFNGLKSGIQ